MFLPLRDAIFNQLKFLLGYIKALANGELTDAQATARGKSYANAAWESFWRGRQAQVKQRAVQAPRFRFEERRVLDPFADHCEHNELSITNGWKSCPEYAAEGWQVLGHFPLPGQESPCLSSCRCHMEYRMIEIATGEITYLYGTGRAA